MQIAEITINYKPLKKISEMQRVSSSQEVISFFRSIWSDKLEYIEESYLLLLNRHSRALGYMKLSEGGTASTIVDVKMIYQVALKSNSHAIIIAHNHPSGNTKPSNCDIQLTKRLKEAGDFLDIKLLDHIILTSDSYYSFADNGCL